MQKAPTIVVLSWVFRGFDSFYKFYKKKKDRGIALGCQHFSNAIYYFVELGTGRAVPLNWRQRGEAALMVMVMATVVPSRVLGV